MAKANPPPAYCMEIASFFDGVIIPHQKSNGMPWTQHLVVCILREEQDLLYTHNQVKTILEYLQNVKREPNIFCFWAMIILDIEAL